MLIGILLLIIVIIVVAALNNKNTSVGSTATDYTNQYLSDPYLEKLFNYIEQSFLQQINEIPELERTGKYRRLFEGGQYPRKLDFEVDVSDHYVSVKICYPYMDYISFVSISAQLNLYNIAFGGDYSEVDKKKAGLAVAVFERIIKLLPNTITTETFDIKKEDDSYEISFSRVKKELVAYYTVKNTAHML